MEFHGKKSIFQRSAVRRQMSDKFETFLTLRRLTPWKGLDP